MLDLSREIEFAKETLGLLENKDILNQEEKCNQPECCKCCPNNTNDFCFCTLPNSCNVN